MTQDAEEFRRLAGRFEARRNADLAVRLLSLPRFDSDSFYNLSVAMHRRLSPLDDVDMRRLNNDSWYSMGPELTRLTRLHCLDLLGLEPELIERIEARSKRRWWEICK